LKTEEAPMAAMDPASVPAAEMRALKREELAAVGSIILHELYFVNLGGDGKVPSVVTSALERNFGGIRQWWREFVAAAYVDAFMRIIEWAVVAERPMGATGVGPRHEADTSNETFEVGCRVTTVLRERGFDARYIRGGLAAWYGAGGARAVRSW
jgi:hypothetical protein